MRRGWPCGKRVIFCDDLEVFDQGSGWRRFNGDTERALRIYRRVRIVREEGFKRFVAQEWRDGRRVKPRPDKAA